MHNAATHTLPTTTFLRTAILHTTTTLDPDTAILHTATPPQPRAQTEHAGNRATEDALVPTPETTLGAIAMVLRNACPNPDVKTGQTPYAVTVLADTGDA